MNYYKQGDPSRADKIKAAFKSKGIDTSSNSNYGISNLFYYSYNGEVAVTQNGSIINIIKTHPDYTELELPVEPKFKEGDWLVYNDGNTFCLGKKEVQIQAVEKDSYIFTQDGSGFHKFIDDHCRLWTIADAQDGDVLVSGLGNPFIYDGNIEFSSAGAYVGVSRDGRIRFDMFPSKAWASIKDVKPATNEQRILLFKKIQEAGYQWYAGKKELRKIQPHYDISNFRAGMPVLVRADNNCRWDYSVFSRITGNVDWNFAVCNGVSFTQCIPFNEETKHLVGTTDMCPEEYVNW